jgi:hypothetical protein|tara:strand:- start:466 stop:621 length:156 start_codon:yes stop_codon:yes gene_type:complete
MSLTPLRGWGFFTKKEIIMPMVKGKKYAYTPAGKAAAAKAKKTPTKKVRKK